ncbi:hypothetical protein LJR289_001603 [Pseudoduganella sp. LjRoot289]
MTLALTLKTLAIVAFVAASTVAIVLSEQMVMAVPISQHAAF